MLELKNINVSFRSERQDKIFGHTRQQVLFDRTHPAIAIHNLICWQQP